MTREHAAVAGVGYSTIPRERGVDCRPLVVDRDRAYSGAFKGKPADVEGAGG